MSDKTTHARILIVDDEPINLDLFEVMLSRLGFEVAKARTAGRHSSSWRP